MSSRHQLVPLIATLKSTLPVLNTDANDVHIDMIKFIDGSILSFDQVLNKVLSDNYKDSDISEFIHDLRQPFLRILGWYYRVEYAGLRYRARECLDMINHHLGFTKPFKGLALARDALDNIYGHIPILADRFAFDPHKYSINLAEGGWKGSMDLNLFAIQCNLENGRYENIEEFAADLETLGSEYERNTRDEVMNKGVKVGDTHFMPTPMKTSDGTREPVLYDYAVYIVQVAHSLLHNTERPNCMTHIGKNAGAGKRKYSVINPIPPSRSSTHHSDCKLFAIDESPVWKLAKIDSATTTDEPYTTFVKGLLVEFEKWAKDVPLCKELRLKARISSTEEEWLKSASQIDKKATTLESWNASRSKKIVLDAVIDAITHQLDGNTRRAMIYSSNLPDLDNDEVQGAMRYAWECFLAYRSINHIALQQKANSNFVQSLRNSDNTSSFSPRLKRMISSGGGGKGAAYMAIQNHVMDISTMHNASFLDYWSRFPDLDAAIAIREFDCREGTEEGGNDGGESWGYDKLTANDVKRIVSGDASLSDIVEPNHHTKFDSNSTWFRRASERVITSELREYLQGAVENDLSDIESGMEDVFGKRNRPSDKTRNKDRVEALVDEYMIINNDVRLRDPGRHTILYNKMQLFYNFNAEQLKNARLMWTGFAEWFLNSKRFTKTDDAWDKASLVRERIEAQKMSPVQFAISNIGVRELVRIQARTVQVYFRAKAPENAVHLSTNDEMDQFLETFDEWFNAL